VIGVVVERKFADPDHIAFRSAGTGQQPRNAEFLETLVDVGERFGRGHIVEVYGTENLATHDPEIVIVDSFDPRSVGVRTQDHATLRHRLFLTRFVHEAREAPDEFAHPLVRDRRDHHALPGLHDFRNGRVGLGPDDHPRPLEELRVVLAEFGEQHIELLGG